MDSPYQSLRSSPREAKRLANLRKDSFKDTSSSSPLPSSPLTASSNPTTMSFDDLLNTIQSNRSRKLDDAMDGSSFPLHRSPPSSAIADRVLSPSTPKKKRKKRRFPESLPSNRKKTLLSPERINSMRSSFHADYTHLSFLDKISDKHIREKYTIYNKTNSVLVDRPSSSQSSNLSKKSLMQLLRDQEEKMMVFDYAMKKDSPLRHVRRQTITNQQHLYDKDDDNPYMVLYNSPLSDRSTNWRSIQLNISPVDDLTMKAIAKNQPLPRFVKRASPPPSSSPLAPNDVSIPSLMMPLAKDQYQQMMDKHAAETSRLEQFQMHQPLIDRSLKPSGFKLSDDVSTADSIASLESSLHSLDHSSLMPFSPSSK